MSKAMVCSKCGKEIPRGSRICPGCGAKMPKVATWVWVALAAVVVIAIIKIIYFF